MNLAKVGDILKSKRKALGLTINDVVSNLRIKRQSLEDIETGCFDTNDIYMLGYVRLYSKYLGVNIDVNSIKEEGSKLSSAKKEDDKFCDEDGVALSGTPSLRVVIITFVVMISSITLVLLLSGNNNLDNNTVAYVERLKVEPDSKIVVKESGYTYIVHKHDIPLVIRANDSVEVTISDSNHKLLETLKLRVGEVVPFPVSHELTVVSTSMPDSIEILKKES